MHLMWLPYQLVNSILDIVDPKLSELEKYVQFLALFHP